MGRHTLEGNPSIDVTLRRSARAKRLSLRVSRLDGRVTLTLPNGAAEREAVAFLKAREGWLRGHLDDLAPVNHVVAGSSICFEGRELQIEAAPTKSVQLDGHRLVVPEHRAAGPQVRAFLKTQARDALAVASDRYANLVSRNYDRLSLRDTRSRWGSCSSQGTLMFSWRLIMAPPAVLNYVAAHEVAHLVEMNHSRAFWAIVARLDPDFEVSRSWLRTRGDLLHRVQFDC